MAKPLTEADRKQVVQALQLALDYVQIAIALNARSEGTIKTCREEKDEIRAALSLMEAVQVQDGAQLTAFADRIRAEEREKAAKEGDHWQQLTDKNGGGCKCGLYIACAIRGLSNGERVAAHTKAL